MLLCVNDSVASGEYSGTETSCDINIKMESVSGPAEGSVSLVNKHIKATHSYEQHCPSTTINTKNCHTIMAFWCFTVLFFE